MTPEKIVHLTRLTMEVAVVVSAPILVVAIAIGLIVSMIQVMTSLQETTLSTVPRLAAVALTTFILMPWLLRKLVSFASLLFSNFHPFVGIR